jgi:hypothetical protein
MQPNALLIWQNFIIYKKWVLQSKTLFMYVSLQEVRQNSSTPLLFFVLLVVLPCTIFSLGVFWLQSIAGSDTKPLHSLTAVPNKELLDHGF